MCKFFSCKNLVQINFCTALFVRKVIHVNILFTPCINWSSRGPEGLGRSESMKNGGAWA